MDERPFVLAAVDHVHTIDKAPVTANHYVLDRAMHWEWLAVLHRRLDLTDKVVNVWDTHADSCVGIAVVVHVTSGHLL